MIYLVGGCSRSGKTTLALRMLRERQVPYLCTDVLVRGLRAAKLAAGASEDEDLRLGEAAREFLIPMLDSIIFSGRPYLIEGVPLRPGYIRAMIDRAPNRVTGCVLGYPGMSEEDKLAAVLQHPSEVNNWLTRREPEFQREFLARQLKNTENDRIEAEAAGIRFFSTADDFMGGIDAAMQHLFAEPS